MGYLTDSRRLVSTGEAIIFLPFVHFAKSFSVCSLSNRSCDSLNYLRGKLKSSWKGVAHRGWGSAFETRVVAKKPNDMEALAVFRGLEIRYHDRAMRENGPQHLGFKHKCRAGPKSKQHFFPNLEVRPFLKAQSRKDPILVSKISCLGTLSG